MVKRLLLTGVAVAATLGGAVAAAPGASAEINTCGQGMELSDGAVTIFSCIHVDLSNGRASALVYFSPQVATAHVPITVTINRSGNTATNKCTLDYTGGPQPLVCNAYAGNPPDVQAWRSDTALGDIHLSSPTVYDT